MAKEFKTAPSVRQAENKVLLGIEETLETPFRFDINNVSSIFNVKTYGAKGDNSTDDTAAVQSAITAANLVNGTVYFPVGNYIIGGALQASYNSQLIITPKDFNGGTYGSIKFKGETPPTRQGLGAVSGDLAQTREGVNIISTIQGTGTEPAVLGTIAYGSGLTNFNNNTIFVDDIRVLTTPNGSNSTTMSGFNFQYATACSFENVVVGLTISSGITILPQTATYGIRMPRPSSNTNMTLKNCLVSGYYHGYVLGEHVQVLNCDAFGCYHGFTVPRLHLHSTIVTALVQWCVTAINSEVSDLDFTGSPGIGTSADVEILSLELEWKGNDVRWLANQYIINDPSDYLRGTCSYAYYVFDSSSVTVTNGGVNMMTRRMDIAGTSRSVTGSRGGNAALTNLLSILVDQGLIYDNTTA
jgi:hypothetical protein